MHNQPQTHFQYGYKFVGQATTNDNLDLINALALKVAFSVRFSVRPRANEQRRYALLCLVD